MELDTVARVRNSFYRLCGTVPEDPELTLLGEEPNEVADTYLTRGCHAAQRFMLGAGYTGWRRTSDPLIFEVLDEYDAHKRALLPDDFLRAIGGAHGSALVQRNGLRWGREASPDARDGNVYWIDDYIWLGRNARPPSELLLNYHYRHRPFRDGALIDFPMEARALIAAEAASLAREENWLPGAQDMELKIERAVTRARQLAADLARTTQKPRRLRKQPRYGTRY